MDSITSASRALLAASVLLWLVPHRPAAAQRTVGTMTNPPVVARVAASSADAGSSSISVLSGASAEFRITLNSFPAGQRISVALASSNSSAATLPTSVSVSIGSTGSGSATVPVTTRAVGSATTVTLSANVPNVGTASASITVNPPPLGSGTVSSGSATPLTIGSVAVSPNPWRPGTTIENPSLEVFLSAPAPAGGYIVTLASNHQNVVVPASLTIPAGQTQARVGITARQAPVDLSVTLSASAGGTGKGVVLSIPAPRLSSLLLSGLNGIPGSRIYVFGGNEVTLHVALSDPAASQTSVTLASTDPVVSLPSAIHFTAGQQRATLRATTLTTDRSITATVSASLNGVTQAANVTVQPITPSAITVGPPSGWVLAGAPVSIEVTLVAPASAGGVTVPLTSSNPAALQVPPNVIIPEGAQSWSGTVMSASSVTPDSPVSVSAGQGSHMRAASVTVRGLLGGLALSPQSVTSGGTVTGTITLNGQAPSGGFVVPLTSSNPAAQLSPSITIPAGLSSATFTITTTPVTADVSVTITAGQGGAARTQTLLLRRP